MKNKLPQLPTSKMIRSETDVKKVYDYWIIIGKYTQVVLRNRRDNGCCGSSLTDDLPYDELEELCLEKFKLLPNPEGIRFIRSSN